ncbi:MAG: TolB-like 6-bladed beta-propeller domain-containing protein [Dysgonamonadaceae bacterium]|jgi:hypothetical protein|nr:TolB-like 6-bladed beta-propeller domain-containing protein [Dysgonamonadaceae bacterium]
MKKEIALHARDNFFHVFSLKDNVTKHFLSFGKVGNGPEELIACSGFDITDGYLSVIEPSKAILYTYPIEQLITRGIGKPNRILELPKEYVPFVRTTNWGNKGTAVLDSKGGYRFILLNNQGNSTGKFHKIPNKENQDLQSFLLQQLWTSCLYYDQNSDVLVLGTILGDVLEIYNLRDGTEKVLVGKQGEPSINREGSALSLISANGYQEIFIGNSEIYALYSDISIDEVKKADNEGRTTPNGGNLIRIFSFDGELKKVFVLDKYINGFNIDFEKKIIYGVTSNSDSQLCIFNLPS